MHKQNFDTTSENAYPLSIDRMAELQSDIQVPLEIVAGMQIGNCILSGCRNAGEAGYVLLGIPGENNTTVYEVFEVRAGNSLDTHLVFYGEHLVPAQNGDNQSVTVRKERYVDWNDGVPGEGVDYVACAEYDKMQRLWVKKAPQDDANWVSCTGGLWWHTPNNGTSLRVQRVGGLVHLWGSVKYGLLLDGIVRYTGNANTMATEYNMTRTSVSNVPVLPDNYFRVNGEILIPIKYNDTPSFAVINSDGQLLISQDPELGDTLEINTWYEL